MASPPPSGRRSSDSSLAEFDGLIDPIASPKYARNSRIRGFWSCIEYIVRRATSYLLPSRSGSFRFTRACSFGRRRYLIALVFRIFLVLFGILATISVINGVLWSSYQNFPEHYRKFEEQVVASDKVGPANLDNKRIFIASNIVQEELIQGSWGDNLVELVRLLGPANTFVSIYENDSGEGTPKALQELRSKLECNTSIVTGDHIDLSTVRKQTMPNGEQRTRRLEYLAEVRNRAMKPLDEASDTKKWADQHPDFRVAEGKYDRVLFLNDIYYKPIEAAQLLFLTNNGDYTTACAADFVAHFSLYDSFVIRDNEGYGMGFHYYPWFAPVGRADSRYDVLAEKDAVRVRSCWGGMASFDATIFQQSTKDIVTSSGHATLPGIRFRASEELFWEESECCLIFGDSEVRTASLRKENRGVFMNPYIRVAYSKGTWDALPFWRRYERSLQFFQYIISKIGFPEYNPRRTNVAGQRVVDTVWHFRDEKNEKDGRYEAIDRTALPGSFCGQRRMFILRKNLEDSNRKGGKNWEKYPVPWW